MEDDWIISGQMRTTSMSERMGLAISGLKSNVCFPAVPLPPTPSDSLQDQVLASVSPVVSLPQSVP